MEKPELKIIGMDGNAFSIIAKARRAAKKAGWTSDEISSFCEEAMDGDYGHLLSTTMKHFDVK